ncbi:MAG: hypothetical protein AB1921_15680 [Thermodesulfobacteriota bacterium]
MSRFKAGLIIAAVFLCGMVAGAFVTRQVFWYSLGKILAGDKGMNESLVLHKLSVDLDLSREQREKIRPVVDETFRNIYLLRIQQRPELDAVLSDGIRKAKRFLDAEQARKLDELFLKSQKLRSASDKWVTDGKGGQPPSPVSGESEIK